MKKINIIKYDEKTGNWHVIEIPFPDKLSETNLLPLCNVGDFIYIDEQNIYRRIKGGIRRATEEEIALIYSLFLL